MSFVVYYTLYATRKKKYSSNYEYDEFCGVVFVYYAVLEEGENSGLVSVVSGRTMWSSPLSRYEIRNARDDSKNTKLLFTIVITQTRKKGLTLFFKSYCVSLTERYEFSNSIKNICYSWLSNTLTYFEKMFRYDFFHLKLRE